MRSTALEFKSEGILHTLGTRRGARQMEAAAFRLPKLPSRSGPPIVPSYLTGRKFWYQTLFCAYSLARHSDRPVTPVLYDDGSFLPDHVSVFREHFPDCRFFSKQELVAKVEQHLPVDRFPYLRQKAFPYRYPHLAKLTEVHAGSTGWKLVLDSDMLFYRKPDYLIQWFDNPSGPIFMADVLGAYGHSDQLMEELAGAPIPRDINVGVCGLHSDALDWDWVEHVCRELVQREGLQYFLEQALSVIIAARQNSVRCPREDYIVYPSREQVRSRKGILHHYTAESKAWYFRYGWRHAMTAA
jgi:hypothetical protein